MDNHEKLKYTKCDFCTKDKSVVTKLIVGDRVAICNECVDLWRFAKVTYQRDS